MKIVIANWKMNPTSLKEAFSLVNHYRKIKSLSIWIAPPSLFLEPLLQNFKQFYFGAQNIYYEDRGPYTGEISPLMIKNLKARFVLINHSERRKIMKENLELANKKIVASLKNNLKSVICMGEDQQIKNKNKLKREWLRQLKILFKKINFKNNKQIIIAYEPTWAISTYQQGSVPPETVYEFIIFLRKIGYRGKIIYGGSVFLENISNYLTLPLDGFLIGSQSLIPKNFIKICQLISKN
jgi:triosephosphate isomerase